MQVVPPSAALGWHTVADTKADHTMVSFKGKLKAAQQAYLQHKLADALEQCNSALQDNEESPDGLMYVQSLRLHCPEDS